MIPWFMISALVFMPCIISRCPLQDASIYHHDFWQAAFASIRSSSCICKNIWDAISRPSPSSLSVHCIRKLECNSKMLQRIKTKCLEILLFELSLVYRNWSQINSCVRFFFVPCKTPCQQKVYFWNSWHNIVKSSHLNRKLKNDSVLKP